MTNFAKTALAPILLFAAMLHSNSVNADGCDFMPGSSQPTWTFDSPAIEGYYVGVGLAEEDDDGPDAQIEKSRQSALADLASSIQVSVRSSLRIEIQSEDGDVESDIEQITETITDTSLQDVIVDDTWLDRRRCIVWTRVKIPVAAIEAKRNRELQNRKLTLLDSFYDKAQDKTATTSARNAALDQAYILFEEIDFSALAGITSKAYYTKLLENLASTVRRSASAKREADALREQAEKLLLQANNASDASTRSSKTAEAVRLLKSIIAANPVGGSDDRFDGESAAFRIAEVEKMRNNLCEAKFRYEIVRDRSLSADWKTRATQLAEGLRCSGKQRKDMAWRRSFDGVATTYMCASDIAGVTDDWSKPCENMQGFLAGFGAVEAAYPDLNTDQLVQLAYRLDKDRSAAASLRGNGRVMIFVAKGKVKQRKNQKNPSGADHQFSGRIYSFVVNDGALDFKDKYSGTGGWNPISEEMAVEVLGLNAAKRFRKQYLQHIRNN